MEAARKNLYIQLISFCGNPAEIWKKKRSLCENLRFLTKIRKRLLLRSQKIRKYKHFNRKLSFPTTSKYIINLKKSTSINWDTNSGLLKNAFVVFAAPKQGIALFQQALIRA